MSIPPIVDSGMSYLHLDPAIFAYELLFTIVEHVGGAQCMSVELYGCYLLKGVF